MRASSNIHINPKLNAHTGSYLFWGTVVSAISISVWFFSSEVVDGIRYFWLDDDQMISMQYAKNLANGDGLVWFRGIRPVEGYTNFGWTLIMSLLHLLPIPLAKLALGLKLINLALVWVILKSAQDLFYAICEKHGIKPSSWVDFLLLGSISISFDILHWSANGTESILLCAVFLFAIRRILFSADSNHFPLAMALVVGALPLIRSDAYFLSAPLTLFVLFRPIPIRKKIWWVLVCASLPMAHLIFRVSYYGELLPNTYYLKVAGLTGFFQRGMGYIGGFLGAYTISVPLAFISVASLIRADKKFGYGLLGILLIPLSYPLFIGDDGFHSARLLLPILPVFFILAFVWLQSRPRPRVQLATSLLLFIAISLRGSPFQNRPLSSKNANPWAMCRTALYLKQHSLPQARIAAGGIGVLAYFSERQVIDMLGKVDPVVARLPPNMKFPVGHNKFSVDYSLASLPEYLVLMGSHKRHLPIIETNPGRAYSADGFQRSVVVSDPFREHYLRHIISEPKKLPGIMLFASSKENQRLEMNYAQLAWMTPHQGAGE